MGEERDLNKEIGNLKRKRYKQPAIVYEELPEDIQELLKRSNNDYENITLTQSQINKLRMKVERAIKGSAGNLQMSCLGANCPVKLTCPLMGIETTDNDGNTKIVNMAPTDGSLCPIEEEIIPELRRQYTKAVCNKLGKEPEELDVIHLSSINELIECELHEMRAQGLLQQEGITESYVTAVTNAGEAVFDERINKAFEIKEKVKKRKDRIMQQLMITEEMDVKYRKKGTGDSLTERSRALKELLELANDVSNEMQIKKAVEKYKKTKGEDDPIIINN